MRKNYAIHQYSTRQANDFHMEQSARSKWLKSIFKSGLALYHELHTEIKQLASVGKLRKRE